MKLLKAIEVDSSSIVCSIIHIPPRIRSSGRRQKGVCLQGKRVWCCCISYSPYVSRATCHCQKPTLDWKFMLAGHICGRTAVAFCGPLVCGTALNKKINGLTATLISCEVEQEKKQRERTWGQWGMWGLEREKEREKEKERAEEWDGDCQPMR